MEIQKRKQGKSDIGKLMHDFNCTEADDMHFDLMAERTRYFKENPKGVREMCKVMEDMRNEALQFGIQKGIKEGAINSAKKMLKNSILSLEEIAEYAGLSLDEVKKLKSE